MKNYLLILLCFLSFSLFGQVTFWTDDFNGSGPTSGDRDAPNHVDGDNGTGTTGCGLGDYFFRTNLASDSGNGLDAIFTGFTGSYWRGEDLDGCITNPDVIDFTGINIAGLTNLGFSGSFAVRDGNRFESDDFMRVEYSIDGGAFMPGITFESDLSGGSNGLFREDTNGDGTGDGTVALGLAFQEFSFLISGTGTTLALRFTGDIDGTGEEFGIEDLALQHSIPMPVELTSFTAKKQDSEVKLFWETASEENNDYFQVEHSIDGRDFIMLDQVKGNGTTSDFSYYSNLHRTPMAGTNYYRLKQVDFDGRFEYSKIVSVDFKNENNDVAIYPNPFEESIIVSFPSLGYQHTDSDTRRIEIVDIHGRLVQTKLVSVHESNVTLNLSILPSGTYFLRTFEKQASFTTQRIMKF